MITLWKCDNFVLENLLRNSEPQEHTFQQQKSQHVRSLTTIGFMYYSRIHGQYKHVQPRPMSQIINVQNHSYFTHHNVIIIISIHSLLIFSLHYIHSQWFHDQMIPITWIVKNNVSLQLNKNQNTKCQQYCIIILTHYYHLCWH